MPPYQLPLLCKHCGAQGPHTNVFEETVISWDVQRDNFVVRGACPDCLAETGTPGGIEFVDEPGANRIKLHFGGRPE